MGNGYEFSLLFVEYQSIQHLRCICHLWYHFRAHKAAEVYGMIANLEQFIDISNLTLGRNKLFNTLHGIARALNNFYFGGIHPPNLKEYFILIKILQQFIRCSSISETFLPLHVNRSKTV